MPSCGCKRLHESHFLALLRSTNVPWQQVACGGAKVYKQNVCTKPHSLQGMTRGPKCDPVVHVKSISELNAVHKLAMSDGNVKRQSAPATALQALLRSAARVVAPDSILADEGAAKCVAHAATQPLAAQLTPGIQCAAPQFPASAMQWCSQVQWYARHSRGAQSNVAVKHKRRRHCAAAHARVVLRQLAGSYSTKIRPCGR